MFVMLFDPNKGSQFGTFFISSFVILTPLFHFISPLFHFVSPFLQFSGCPRKFSNQLIVTLCTLSIYPSVLKQLIRTFFEAHIELILVLIWTSQRIQICKRSRKNKSSSTSGRATKALPPPLEPNGQRNFFSLNFFLVLKYPKTGFLTTFFHPTIFGLKQPYFLENIVTAK